MYEAPKIISKKLNIHPNTLRRWANDKKIKTVKTVGGHRRYNIDEITGEKRAPKQNVCYCRVSSKKQKDDLARQISYMQEKYPTYKSIQDIGSGINYKRKGLIAILELASKGEIREVVVSYKDRLCCFGFELIEYIIAHNGGRLMVQHKHRENASPSDELTRDLLSILTVFSCRVYGHRKYTHKNKKDTIVSNSRTTNDVETMDGYGQIYL
jgi:predicted site-specific integrase-resolvase